MVEWLRVFEQRVAEDWGHLGAQVTASGVRCVGHVPQVGRAAWLHRFYPGCPLSELDAAEQRTGVAIPGVWRETLLVLNGVGLFITKVSLRGVLSGNQNRRVIEDPLPISLENANTLERPSGPALRATDLVIGGSSLGDGALYILREDETVTKTTRRGDTELAAWQSVPDMIENEYQAVSKLHDREGTYQRV
jgi:hypothetical protein